MNPFSLTLILIRVTALAATLFTVAGFIDKIALRPADLPAEEVVRGHALPTLINLAILIGVLALARPLARQVTRDLGNLELTWQPEAFRTLLRVVAITMIVTNFATSLVVFTSSGPLNQDPILALAQQPQSPATLVLGVILLFTAGTITRMFQQTDLRTDLLQRIQNNPEAEE